MVVSEIGEQWSPQTAPAMQAELSLIHIFCFGIAKALRFGQRFGEICAALLHGRQNEIRGSVHDAAEGFNRIHPRNAQQVRKPGDAAAHGCRERKMHSVFAC